MKRIIILFFVLTVWTAWDGVAAQDGLMSLRLMTYNIRHGEGMDGVVDLDRQAKVIGEAVPDVVGLQEVDSCVKRSGRIDEAGYLASALDMHCSFGPAIPLTGGKYGVAILSREKPLSVRNIPLPGKEKRTLLVCEFEKYVFANTHLDLDEENRLTSLAVILEEAARWEKPFFICGDWNDEPSSKLIRMMRKSFYFINNIMSSYLSWTFPAAEPSIIIDYIACYGDAVKTVKSRKVINEPVASDHRPIIAEVEVDIASGIRSLSALSEWDRNGRIFDLAGRSLSNARQSGTYIRRGRKIIVNGANVEY